jgi:hypothetical protein
VRAAVSFEPEISYPSGRRKTTRDRREGACAASHSKGRSGQQKRRSSNRGAGGTSGALQTLTAPIADQPIAYQQSALCPERYTIRTRPTARLRPYCARGTKDLTSVVKKLGRRLQKGIGLRECEIA